MLTRRKRKRKNYNFYRTYLMKKKIHFQLKGNCFEINYSLEVLAQLSFDVTIKNDLMRNKELLLIINALPKRIINEISTKNNDEMEVFNNIQCLIEQINWNMRNKVTFVKSEHLMISHDIGCRDNCLKIKENLENLGYKVQITDTDFISSIKMIEKCSCFIMCVNERYRQSVICQNQAQHAFNLNKRIISLIMQDGFENAKGWLGMILSKGPSIDFIKQEMDESIQKLQNELKLNLEEPDDYYYFFQLKTTLEICEYDVIDEWGEDDAKNWFMTNNLSLTIFEYLKPCNGKMLKQMFQIKLNCPEFYYNSLKNIPNIKFNDMVLFSTFLDELFDIKKLRF